MLDFVCSVPLYFISDMDGARINLGTTALNAFALEAHVFRADERLEGATGVIEQLLSPFR